eukprot:CAMPEP_0170298372 /NCGR_PEP_ID=MMETSP0116_2-20130129/49365_1 /TAXON_ID=400756 /ORGANISM="Durinskia baltica, Strain CSIRO CS-38" /LENGTH=85 /DNA_ID=CAMNT_0010550033 /DNA_START=63 /DNA_END=318 /DNA_ORIENTATION=-
MRGGASIQPQLAAQRSAPPIVSGSLLGTTSRRSAPIFRHVSAAHARMSQRRRPYVGRRSASTHGGFQAGFKTSDEDADGTRGDST